MAITERYVTSTGSATYADSTNILTPMSLTTAFANAVAGDRINIAADGFYSRTANDTFATSGSTTTPIIFRGYYSTPGDGGWEDRSAGSTWSAQMPPIQYAAGFRLSCTGAFVIFETIAFSGNFNGTLVTSNATGFTMKSCSVSNSSTGASAVTVGVSGTGTILYDCAISLFAFSGGTAAISDSGTARIIGCRVNNLSSNATGIKLSSVSFVANCVVFGRGIGVRLDSINARCTLLNNTIAVNSGGDGIDVITGNTNLQCFVGNMITDNTGYGIDLNNANVAAFLAGNRTRDNTSGAIRLGTDWVSATDYDAITTDTGTSATDYKNSAGNNFNLIATSPAVNAVLGDAFGITAGALQRRQSVSEATHSFVG